MFHFVVYSLFLLIHLIIALFKAYHIYSMIFEALRMMQKQANISIVTLLDFLFDLSKCNHT
jgi:hypothetical protein